MRLACSPSLFILLTLFAYFLANKYPCNPQKKKLIGKFLMQQWLKAQLEIGLEESQLISVTKSSSAEYVLITVNSFTPGVRVFYALNGRPITYAVMWKCASEGLTQNLKAVISNKSTKSTGPTGGLFNYDIKSIYDVHIAIASMKEVAVPSPPSLESTYEFF